MINSVEAYNGKIIQLTGNRNNDGENVSGIAIIGGLFVTWPALLFRGSNAVIEAGTIFSAYVSGTTVLEEAEEYVPPARKPKTAKKTSARKKPAKKRR